MTGIVVTMAVLVCSADPAQLATEAEAAFAAGRDRLARGEDGRADFRRAAAALVRLRRTGISNVLLHRKLGDCYLLSGDLPRAIMHYRIEERIDPNDRALRDALAAAMAQVVVDDRDARAGSARGWSPFLRHMPPGPTLRVAVGLYAAAWVLVAWWLARGRTVVLLAAAALLLGAIGLTTLIVGLYPPLSPFAVVARDGVPLRQGDGAAYPPVGERLLSRGHDVEVLHHRGDWLQVQLPGPDGDVGWVHVRDVVLSEENGDP
ncbi:MAG: SH3 domain-containing protein [Gemmataceae bacterium]